MRWCILATIYMSMAFDGYGGSIGQELDRNHEPPLEIVTLDDYRTRHAQYKTDPDLQAAHAAAPWICTWDDHESTNNSYRTGAENHNPEARRRQLDGPKTGGRSSLSGMDARP